ncbi:MAG: hypothetical protein LBV79_05400 [Candidatus Adiutrix sp.]|jgi:hypothetical protein|nr:hypothetical protein [Candidatus Adiutrix sp.]
MKKAWLALVFALLSCVMPIFIDAFAKTYPRWGTDLFFKNGQFVDGATLRQTGQYRGYSVRERTVAGLNLLEFSFCMLGFFMGRAGIKGARDKRQNICIFAAALAMGAVAMHIGGGTFMLLSLFFLQKLMQKEEAPVEQ